MPHGIIAWEDVYDQIMIDHDITYSACDAGTATSTVVGSRDIAYTYGHTPASISTKPWTYRPPDFRREWIPPTPWHKWLARTDVPVIPVFYTRSYEGFCGIPPIPTTTTWKFDRHAGWNGTYIYGPDFSYDVVVEAGATARALEDVADGESANLALALLERKETENLLVTTMRDFAALIGKFRRNLRGGSPFEAAKLAARTDKSLLKARRKAVRKYRRRSESLSDRERFLIQAPQKWIELQYGFKPALQDVYDSMAAVDAHQRFEHYSFSKTGTARSDKVVGLGFQVTGSVACSSGVTLAVSSSCKVRLDYSINTASLRKLADSGFANPAYLLWNRLPASFLLDWLYDVSGYFNQFSAALGKDFLGGTKTTVFRANTTNATAGPSQPLPVEPGVKWTRQYDSEAVKPSYTEFSMNRVVLSEFPSPVPPAFKNPCSPVHVANALSLLALAFGRRLDTSLLR